MEDRFDGHVNLHSQAAAHVSEQEDQAGVLPGAAGGGRFSSAGSEDSETKQKTSQRFQESVSMN